MEAEGLNWPFTEGLVAGLRGEDPRSCPYAKMTAEWNRWQSGHRAGTEFMVEENGTL